MRPWLFHLAMAGAQRCNKKKQESSELLNLFMSRKKNVQVNKSNTQSTQPAWSAVNMNVGVRGLFDVLQDTPAPLINGLKQN